MFVWCFSSLLWIFHSDGDVTIAVGGMQILCFTRHSSSLSSKCYLACNTRTTRTTTRTRDTHNCYRAVCSKLLQFRSVAIPDFLHATLPRNNYSNSDFLLHEIKCSFLALFCFDHYRWPDMNTHVNSPVSNFSQLYFFSRRTYQFSEGISSLPK